jgi:hypothetical protein
VKKALSLAMTSALTNLACSGGISRLACWARRATLASSAKFGELVQHVLVLASQIGLDLCNGLVQSAVEDPAAATGNGCFIPIQALLDNWGAWLPVFPMLTQPRRPTRLNVAAAAPQGIRFHFCRQHRLVSRN